MLFRSGITYGFLQGRVPGLAPWGALALGLGSPLLLYSAVYWDHSLVVALAAGALALAAGTLKGDERPRLWPLVACGMLLGLGPWFRNEMYLLIPAALLAWAAAAQRDRARGLIAATAGLAPVLGLLWAINTRLYGSPLGWKGQIGRASCRERV